MISLKNNEDQILAERAVAYNNCPRSDKTCSRRVREDFEPKLKEIKNQRILENSRPRQEERFLGQVKRDCKLYDRMERRTKTQ